VAKTNRYLELSRVDESCFCSLVCLLLTGDAETWLNSLPNDTQEDFKLLEKAFKAHYKKHKEKIDGVALPI
jgi:hypothetical protein